MGLVFFKHKLAKHKLQKTHFLPPIMTLSEDDELVGDDNSSDEQEDDKFRPLASMNYNDKAVSGHGELHARRRYYQQRLYSSPMRHDFSGGLNNNGELQPSNMYISDQLTGTSGIGTVEMGRAVGGQSGSNLAGGV